MFMNNFPFSVILLFFNSMVVCFFLVINRQNYSCWLFRFPAYFIFSFRQKSFLSIMMFCFKEIEKF